MTCGGLAAALGLRGVNLLFLLQHVAGDLLALDGARIGRRDLHRDVFHQGLEIRALGEEVSLAIDLDQHAELAARMNVGPDRAFRSDAARALGGRGDAFLTQPYGGLFEVTLALGQRLFAIHYTRAGLLPQLSYDIGVDFHRSCSMSNLKNVIYRYTNPSPRFPFEAMGTGLGSLTYYYTAGAVSADPPPSPFELGPESSMPF